MTHTIEARELRPGDTLRMSERRVVLVRAVRFASRCRTRPGRVFVEWGASAAPFTRIYQPGELVEVHR